MQYKGNGVFRGISFQFCSRFWGSSWFQRDWIKKQRCTYYSQANQSFGGQVLELLVLAIYLVFLELGAGAMAEVEL